MMNLPTRLLPAVSSGRMTRVEVEKLAATERMLRARTSCMPQVTLPPVHSKEAGAFGHALAVGGATALGASVAGLAGHGLGVGVAKVVDHLTFDRDFNKMVQMHPELKSYPPDTVRAVFTSVRAMSPEYSSDPLLAGTMVSQVLRNRDPLNLHSAPRFDAPLAKTISETGKAVRERSMESQFSQMLAQSAQSGAMAGGMAYQNERNELRKRGLSLEDRGEARAFNAREKADGLASAAKEKADAVAKAQAETAAERAALRARIQQHITQSDVNRPLPVAGKKDPVGTLAATKERTALLKGFMAMPHEERAGLLQQLRL